MSLVFVTLATAILSAIIFISLTMLSHHQRYYLSNVRRRPVPIGAGILTRQSQEGRQIEGAASGADIEMGIQHRGDVDDDEEAVDDDEHRGGFDVCDYTYDSALVDDLLNERPSQDSGDGRSGVLDSAAAERVLPPPLQEESGQERRRRQLRIAPRSDSLGTVHASPLARAGEDGVELADAVRRALGHSLDDDEAAEDAANALPANEEAVGGGEGAADGGLPPPPQAPAAGAGAARVDVLDAFVLFGDVPVAARAASADNQVAFTLRQWASRYIIPQVAVTDLITLLKGVLGRALGVAPATTALLPAKAETLYGYADRVAEELKTHKLLVPIKVDLPEDESVVARGNKRYVEVWYSPDLAYNCAIPLFDRELCSWPAAPLHFKIDSRVPEGWFCADTYYSDDENNERAAAFARASATLDADIAEQIPGVDRSRVGILACGVNSFNDAVNPMRNMSTSVDAHLVTLTNFPTVVARSPYSVVVAGLSTPPAIVRSQKVGKEKTAVHASPATEAAKAMVDTTILMRKFAIPLNDLFKRRSLIVRAANIAGLPPSYPHQVNVIVRGVK